VKIIGCDLHARQQTLSMLDTTTGEVVKTTLKHESNRVREFYCNLARPVRVGIEATGSMQWFVKAKRQIWEVPHRGLLFSDVRLESGTTIPARLG
jgi:hypothetical protein